ERRRLAHVHLRHDPRVGDDPRVGRQQAGHVLPERHLARAQHARQERGGQVRAAAPEGGDLTVRRRAQEPRDHGHRATRQHGFERFPRAALGEREIGRRASERAVGLHDLHRVHVARRAAGRRERFREQARREPLAPRDETTRRARGPRRPRWRATRRRTCGCGERWGGTWRGRYTVSEPPAGRATWRHSAATPCARQARTMASPTWVARAASASATIVGPEPESVAPYAPACRAAALTASYPATSGRR